MDNMQFDNTIRKNPGDGLLEAFLKSGGGLKKDGFVTVDDEEKYRRRGAFSSYTPAIYMGNTTTKATLATYQAEYIKLGDMIYAWGVIWFDGVSFGASGRLNVLLPFNAWQPSINTTRRYPIMGNIIAMQAGVYRMFGVWGQINTGTGYHCMLGLDEAGNVLADNHPWSWAGSGQNGQLAWSIAYRAAY